RAEDDRPAPRLQRQRQLHAAQPSAEHREPLVAPLPSVAIRAMEQRAAVTLADAGHARELVDDPRRDQQEPGPFGSPVGEGEIESGGEALRSGDRHVTALDAVARQLVAPELVELRGADAVARQVTVKSI